MKRYIPYVVAVGLALSCIGSGWAVEKKEKEKPKQEQVKPKEAPKPAPPVDDKKAEKPKPPKKYDDFVDKNNNGVDDRKENLKKK